MKSKSLYLNWLEYITEYYVFTYSIEIIDCIFHMNHQIIYLARADVCNCRKDLSSL